MNNGVNMIGRLSEELKDSILETMPLEITVIDENDRIVAWNRNETRIFKRNEDLIGKDVHECHPEHVRDKVSQLLKDMKEGTKDKHIAYSMGPENQKVKVGYYALRKDGKYIGALEWNQSEEKE